MNENPFIQPRDTQTISYNMPESVPYELAEDIRYYDEPKATIQGYATRFNDYVDKKTGMPASTEVLYLVIDSRLYMTSTKSFIKKFKALVTLRPETAITINLIVKQSTDDNGNVFHYPGFVITV